jgi:CubicO group peptidase (beta-lactamase class C family)
MNSACITLSRRTALIAGGLALIGSGVARAQEPSGVTRDSIDTHLPDLANFVHTILGQTGVPGVSIAIVYKDQIVYLEGFGVRQVGKSEPVNPETVFQLASVSKPVTTTVIAARVGDGQVAWDDPIVRLDPNFAMYDPWVTRQVTLRDMFCHRSGLPDHAGDVLEDLGYDQTEILHRLRYIRSNGRFRSSYAYTNFGFTAAALAAARASGKSWEELSAARLYQPLGMTSTSSRFSDFMRTSNRALGHVREGNAWVAKYARDADAQSPAGGVSSSARDMAMWLRLLLGRGHVDGREIVKSAPLDETHRPQMVTTPTENPMTDQFGFYGLGWNVGYGHGGRIRWSHSGGFNLGAATCVNVLPTEQIGIVALSNTQPIGVPEAICEGCLDVLLNGRLERDWLMLFGPLFARAMAPPYGTAVDNSKPPMERSPQLAAAAYVGSYQSDLYGAIEIVGTDMALALTLGPKHTLFALRHFARDVFSYQPVGENAYGPSAVTFMLGPDQKATSVTIENLDVDGQGTFSRTSP